MRKLQGRVCITLNLSSSVQSLLSLFSTPQYALLFNCAKFFHKMVIGAKPEQAPCLLGLTTYHQSLLALVLHRALCVNSKRLKELKTWTMNSLLYNKDGDHSWTYLFSGYSDRGNCMAVCRCCLLCCLTHCSCVESLDSDLF